MLSREDSTDSCVFCGFYEDECCDTSGVNFVICANGRPWVGTEVRIKKDRADRHCYSLCSRGRTILDNAIS